MTNTCRYHLLGQALAYFDHQTVDELPACDQPAVWRVRVSRGGGTITVTLEAQLCEDHEVEAFTDAGFLSSAKIPRYDST